ncbi:MAG: hypothetical protein OIF58_09490 [Cohaesibacter sp.]|nr:hypothetical protein [Cohaesibacter sp.]
MIASINIVIELIVSTEHALGSGKMAVPAKHIHPMRFLQRFPIGRKIVRKEAQNCQRGLLSSSAFSRITDAVMDTYNRDLMRLPFDRRPKTIDVAVDTVSTLSHITTFFAGGRNIFHLPKTLTTMLANTSLNEIRVSDIQFPFYSFYLSFEGGLNIGLPRTENRIDGAYISRHGDDLSFYVTSRNTSIDPSGRAAWIEGSEPHFFAPLRIQSEEQTLDDLLETAIENKDIALVPSQASIGALQAGTNDARKNGFPISVAETTGYERDAQFSQDALPSVRIVLALICNALCFLSSKPDFNEVWSDDTPAPQVLDVENAKTPKRKRAATGKLAELGFFPIRMIDLHINKEFNGIDSNEQTGTEISAHWRRGHWRRQPYGAGRNRIHLVWIKPVLVRADKGRPVSGHLYNVHMT